VNDTSVVVTFGIIMAKVDMTGEANDLFGSVATAGASRPGGSKLDILSPSPKT